MSVSLIIFIAEFEYIFTVGTQLTFTCSKLTKEKLEKGVKYAQS